MNIRDIIALRVQLSQQGVPKKSIELLQVILSNPRLTNTEIGLYMKITKQAVSKHVNTLEERGIIANHHGHPLWKAWELSNPIVAQLLTQLPQSPHRAVQGVTEPNKEETTV